MRLDWKRRRVLWSAAPLAVGAALLLGACGGSEVSAQDVADRDAQIGELQTQLASASTDAKFWQQLTAVLEPVPLASMTDHRAYALPNGHLIALHFDNMDLSKAENLNWLALGVPGRFCKEDQDRVIAEYGDSFIHFHDLENDIHGGEPGANGVWFVHVGLRDFESPFGVVQQGTPDATFMPTQAPASCDA